MQIYESYIYIYISRSRNVSWCLLLVNRPRLHRRYPLSEYMVLGRVSLLLTAPGLDYTESLCDLSPPEGASRSWNLRGLFCLM